MIPTEKEKSALYVDFLSEAISMYIPQLRKEIQELCEDARSKGRIYLIHPDFADYLEYVWHTNLGTEISADNVHASSTNKNVKENV